LISCFVEYVIVFSSFLLHTRGVITEEKRIADQNAVPYENAVSDQNTIADEDPTAVRRAYSPDKLARLHQVKDTYDPDNVFTRTALHR